MHKKSIFLNKKQFLSQKKIETEKNKNRDKIKKINLIFRFINRCEMLG